MCCFNRHFSFRYGRVFGLEYGQSWPKFQPNHRFTREICGFGLYMRLGHNGYSECGLLSHRLRTNQWRALVLSIPFRVIWIPNQFWSSKTSFSHKTVNNFRLPWNQRTLFGWIGLNLFSAAAAPFYLIINYAFLAFFIGICEQHRAFYLHFGTSVQKLDEMAQTDSPNIKLQLCKLIQFHNMTRM